MQWQSLQTFSDHKSTQWGWISFFFFVSHASEFHYDNLLDRPSFAFMIKTHAKVKGLHILWIHWQATEEENHVDDAHKLNGLYAIYLKEDRRFNLLQMLKMHFFLPTLVWKSDFLQWIRINMRYVLSDFTDEFIKHFKPYAQGTIKEQDNVSKISWIICLLDSCLFSVLPKRHFHQYCLSSLQCSSLYRVLLVFVLDSNASHLRSLFIQWVHY